MSKPTFEDIEHLLKELMLPFYGVVRDISVPLESRRRENDAEHSWSLAFLACALAPHIDPKLDIGRVCQFAVVHDVVEVYAGDTSVWADAELHASKPAREAKATRTIRKNFAQFPWIADTIDSYERKDTSEATYVYALDKFLNNLIMYADKHRHNVENYQTTKAEFDKKLVAHRKKAHTHPGVAVYYDQLMDAFDAHPEYFYKGKSS